MEGAVGIRAPQLTLAAAPSPHLEFSGPPFSGRAVLLLPGFGDTSSVFTRRVHLIDPDQQWSVTVAEPIAAGPGGPMWYLVRNDGPDPIGLTAAVAAISSAVDAAADHAAVERDEVVLVGYSQGGAAALATLLDPTAGPPPRAVGVMGGYLAHRADANLDLSRADGRPVLMVHGADDDMVETVRGRSAARVLDRHGASVTWVEPSGAHRLGRHLLDPLAGWLAELAAGRIPAASPPRPDPEQPRDRPATLRL